MKYTYIIMGAIYMSGLACLSYLDDRPESIETQEEAAEFVQNEENLQENHINDSIHADINKDAVEKPVEAVEKKEAKPTPTTPTTPSIKTVNLDGDYAQYEQIVMNTCPSQRGSYTGWEYDSRVSAIGIVPSGPNKTSPIYSLKSFIETWWNGYKLGRQTGKHMMSTLRQMPEFNDNYANSRVGFYIDLDTLSITWDSSEEEGKSVTISQSQNEVLNQMASDGTNYLRSLESRYKAKCPND